MDEHAETTEVTSHEAVTQANSVTTTTKLHKTTPRTSITNNQRYSNGSIFKAKLSLQLKIGLDERETDLNPYLGILISDVFGEYLFAGTARHADIYTK